MIRPLKDVQLDIRDFEGRIVGHAIHKRGIVAKAKRITSFNLHAEIEASAEEVLILSRHCANNNEKTL